MHLGVQRATGIVGIQRRHRSAFDVDRSQEDERGRVASEDTIEFAIGWGVRHAAEVVVVTVAHGVED